MVKGVCVVKGEGACMVKRGVHGKGGMHSRRDGHFSRRYASYWNAVLLDSISTVIEKCVENIIKMHYTRL